MPDAKTVWLYREKLAKADMVEALFSHFDGYLARQCYIARGARADTGCIDCAGAAQPQHAQGTHNDQEWRGARGLGKQARQAMPERPGRALQRGGSENSPEGCVPDEQARHPRAELV